MKKNKVIHVDFRKESQRKERERVWKEHQRRQRRAAAFAMLLFIIMIFALTALPFVISFVVSP